MAVRDAVVDTNVLAYYWLPGPQTTAALALRRATDDWYAPALWRSEFRNILAGYLRRGTLSLAQARATMQAAEAELGDFEGQVDSTQVLHLVNQSPCSAYDCEFVAFAMTRDLPLVTEDQRILRSFPNIAVGMASLAGALGP